MKAMSQPPGYIENVSSAGRIDGPQQLDALHNMPNSPPVINVERLSKRFGQSYALRDLSLSIQRGEVFGLLGPRGAGKSTFAKVLLGLLHPDRGSVRLFNSTNLLAAKSRVGYMPEQPHYHGNFTGTEYLQIHAQLSGLGSRDARLYATRVLNTVGLEEYAGRRIKRYSRSALQRLGLAVALISGGGKPPELLILDEPSTGLEDEELAPVRDLLVSSHKEGATILICSHRLTEIERICSSVGILRAGRLVTQTGLHESPRVIISALPRSGAGEVLPHLITYLKNLHPSVTVEATQGGQGLLAVTLPAGPYVPRALAIKAASLRALVDARWDVQSLYTESNDLETLYRRAVQPAGERIEGAWNENRATESAQASHNGAAQERSTKGKTTAPLPTLDREAADAESKYGRGARESAGDGGQHAPTPSWQDEER